MNICDHLLQTDSIIGIGPLYQKEHPDVSMRHLYRPVQLQFEVHTKHGSVSIHSDYYYVGSSEADEREKERKKYAQFEDKYFAARGDIAKLIGEESGPKQHHNG